MATLQQWLEDLGLGEYTKAFADNAVDLEIIADLDDGDLEKIGVKLGHRKKILKAIAALAESPLTPPPAAPAREAERRQITVMFCDLVGSTALSEQLDPEDLRTLMQAYQKAAGTVIERYGGHVAQYLGDGLMTYFGWPQAHEDDAERAVRAGLEIVDAVKSVEAPEPLRVRFGIATGPVVVGETGAGDASVPKLAVGETPNLAARIQGLAGPDEVIVGASTRRLIGGTFDLDERGEQTLKGIVEPIRVHRVTGVAEAEGRFEATRGAQLTPFVGREAEVALLLEKWEQARDGEGQLVLLSGEPGIGKSRITQVLRERTEQLPHTRLRYQCSPYHANSALYPVIEQLGRAAGFAGDDSIDERLTKLETLRAGSTRPNEGEGLGEGAARKCALFAAMLSLDTGDRYPPLNMSPQKQKDETLQALVDQVANLAEQNPVLMIFEDAHWIDPTSQEMLDLLVPHLAAKRVLLLITYRPEYEPPWSQGLGNLTAVNLNRLGGKQATAMVTRVTSGKPLPDEVLAQIVAKTDGVPLFVEELTKTVLEAGFLEDQGDRYELTGKLTDFVSRTRFPWTQNWLNRSVQGGPEHDR